MPRSVVVQRTLGVAVAVVLAILAIYAFGRSGDQPAPAASATATANSTGSPSSAPGPPPVTPDVATVATSGPGLTEPGIHVVAQPGADGSLEVVERLKVTTAIEGLSIRLPRATVPGTAGVNPTITGLQAQADGAVVTDTLASPLPDGGDRLELPSPATDILMRYRLEGVVSRSQPAPVGRVLVILPPITAPDPGLGNLPVVVEVVGGNVRNLVCPDLPVTEQLCGRQQGRVWTTTDLKLGRSAVIAQLDLPQPGER